ncbi:SIMPL domain-containing protein [Chelatococcus sp. SYSU_G07232]|uniref:SIMPL domain-containing protein n=1 Tax=Chelatococcus albus TaxID=3047466 RepID=A0ABT7AJR8_9HYPH|nr:SIMPL domain-containing protein [Chelatococcus sp. SYSU_G07232]MDJ1159598.1 SIMPL domain-containing protein [Chelatococcus sp. SYSU_G07232]
MSIARRTVIAFAFAAAAMPALAADDGARSERGRISLSGEGIIAAAPDIATITTGVVTDAKSAREALDGNSKAMAAVIETLKKAGIAPRDIATDGFSVQPRYTHPRQGSSEAPRIDGYEVRNQVTIRVRDLARLGTILDAAVSTGSNQIGGISFDVAEPAALLDKARTAALADATRKARLYSEAAGVTLGRIVAIAEPAADLPRPMMARAEFSAAKAAPVPVETGEREFKVRVNVTWELAE